MKKQNKINEYFKKYYKILNKIVSKELELESLNRQKITISHNYSSEIKQNRTPKGLEIILIQIEETEQKLENLYEQKRLVKEEYIKDFEVKIKDETQKIILIAYYLDKLTTYEIACKIDKSTGYVKKLKQNAINEILKKI